MRTQEHPDYLQNYRIAKEAVFRQPLSGIEYLCFYCGMTTVFI
jgi:hypothetical protein